MKVRGYTTVATFARDDKWGHVELWEQPVWDWAKAVVYHWYDTHPVVIKSTTLVQRIVDRFHPPATLDDLSLSISAKQDLRCYDLTNWKRVIVLDYQITWDELVRIQPMWDK